MNSDLVGAKRVAVVPSGSRPPWAVLTRRGEPGVWGFSLPEFSPVFAIDFIDEFGVLTVLPGSLRGSLQSSPYALISLTNLEFSQTLPEFSPNSPRAKSDVAVLNSFPVCSLMALGIPGGRHFHAGTVQSS